MSEHAERCDGCRRMTYDVERVAMFVGGHSRIERDLCAACLSAALDSFLLAHDPLRLAKVSA